jgi:hypothetical protein
MYRVIALLSIPLLFLSIMSLRCVRLKIGDYYFNQGNFDQAANWYGKEVSQTSQMTIKGELKDEFFNEL